MSLLRLKNTYRISMRGFETMSRSGKLEFRQAPPPRSAIIDENAESLLLIPGLRAEPRHRHFRCASCYKMRTGWLVWVPDGISPKDIARDVTEACRLSAFNGSGSGWCLKCAQSFSKPALRAAAKLTRKIKPSWYSRLKAWLTRW